MESHNVEFLYGPLDGLRVIHTSRKDFILTECGEYYYHYDFMYKPHPTRLFYTFRGPVTEELRLHLAGH